jgi:cardiolipin synthase A/B
MKPVFVVFPVLRGARKFFVEKGRRWSVVEHLLLDAVVSGPESAADLEQRSNLPRRVIIEAFIRLMRAGWVEIITTSQGPKFQATPVGVIQASRDQLPAATVIEPKYRSFAIEQVTGGAFRSRELDIRPQSRLPLGSDEQIVAQLQGSPLDFQADLSAVFTAIEGEDELIVGIDRSPEKLTERYAVVTVRDEVIEGLPGRATPALRFLILARAQQASAIAEAKKSKKPILTSAALLNPVAEPPSFSSQASRSALYEYDDIIVDGAAHQTVLERVLRTAAERIIIHSTFITENRAMALLPHLMHAAAKGVAIDILWGQDDVGTSTSSSRAAAAKLQTWIAEAGRSDSITIHPFSTSSHAKIIIADNGRRGWQAIIGSCNWLASDFNSFECSIRLRDPPLVGEVIRRLASLSRGRPGIWHDLAVDMTILGRRVENMPRGSGRTAPMRLLFAPDHAKLVLEARDRAQKRIFVLSHRLGIASKPVALLPIVAAVKSKDIDAAVFYGRTTGPFSGVDGADLIRELSKEGIALKPVYRPRLHAKVLGWDDDSLAISSLNWLSADPSDAAFYREIGVLVEAPRVADGFIRRFEHARAD